MNGVNNFQPTIIPPLGGVGEMMCAALSFVFLFLGTLLEDLQ